MYFIPYNTSLKDFSRKLRNNSTLSEVLLWNELKNKKMLGYQFNKQKPLGQYIVDFYLNDIKRQRILESLGLTFLRFDDMEVKFALNNVLRSIEGFINKFEEISSSELKILNPPVPLLRGNCTQSIWTSNNFF
jgi:very-short-patch-repair endonuclease